MNSAINKYIFFEYLAGRSNPISQQLVEGWIRDAGNSEVYYQWILDFEERFPLYAQEPDAAYEALLLRISGNHQSRRNSGVPSGLDRSPIKMYALIAASLFFAVLCGWLFRKPILYKTYSTTFGETTTFSLEDGSRVTLNANSSLTVPRFGFVRKRAVALKGEAAFAVMHKQDNRKFIVNVTDGFQIEVLGTEFSVFARSRATRVDLLSGSVRVDYYALSRQRSLLMKPGDQASFNPSGKLDLKNDRDIGRYYASWKDYSYVFDATSMDEVAATVEENFGIKLVFDDESIRQRVVTGRFRTHDAAELIQTIADALDLNMSRNEKGTILLSNY